MQNKRIYVEAIRTIQPGEELGYDYQIERDPEDPPNVDAIFACRCGAANCRGSMLLARKKPRKKSSKKVRKTVGAKAAKQPAKQSKKKSRPAGRPAESRHAAMRREGARRPAATVNAAAGPRSAAGTRLARAAKRGGTAR
jgi:hypothetical protein